MPEYCSKCGDSGELVSGEACDCANAIQHLNDTLASDESTSLVPAPYAGVNYTSSKSNGSDEYNRFIKKQIEEIRLLKRMSKTVFISAPNSRGKSIFVYNVIFNALLDNVKVVPYYDIYEIHNMVNVQNSRSSAFSGKEYRDAVDANVCFIRVASTNNSAALESLSLFIQRRLHKNRFTYIISSVPWDTVVTYDYANSMRNLKGDGTLDSILVKEFGDE